MVSRHEPNAVHLSLLICQAHCSESLNRLALLRMSHHLPSTHYARRLPAPAGSCGPGCIDQGFGLSIPAQNGDISARSGRQCSDLAR